jgi:predicted chitinase
MLATLRIESYDFIHGIFFGPTEEGISYDKAERDYGSGPTATNATRARLNHNTADGDGFRYRGRGLVQMTWKINYEKFAPYVNADIVGNPELTTHFDVATRIMMVGMRDGLFRSGHTLERYLGPGNKDYFHARYIINGDNPPGHPDKAEQFQFYAEQFEALLLRTSQ